MFPPLVLTRSGSKGHYLVDNISTGNTGAPTFLFMTIIKHPYYSKIKILCQLFKHKEEEKPSSPNSPALM